MHILYLHPLMHILYLNVAQKSRNEMPFDILLRDFYKNNLRSRILIWNRTSRPELFYKKTVLRNFAKFTWKHLCQSISFLIKLQA